MIAMSRLCQKLFASIFKEIRENNADFHPYSRGTFRITSAAGT